MGLNVLKSSRGCRIAPAFSNPCSKRILHAAKPPSNRSKVSSLRLQVAALDVVSTLAPIQVTGARVPDYQGNLQLKQSAVTPALRRNETLRLRPPLRAMEASHTSIHYAVPYVELYGNYSVSGPAVIRKVGDTLFALLDSGGSIDLLDGDRTVTLTSAMISVDDDVAASCRLAGQHVELDGAYSMSDTTGACVHDDKVILSVNMLSPDHSIQLHRGGILSHPVNIHPPRSRT